MPSQKPVSQKSPSLKRELGIFEITLSGVGIILGAGIYALIGQATRLSGNSVWLAFLIAALLAAFTGLSYAELSSMFPRAGAEYEYVSSAFGIRLAFVIGWLIILSGVLSAATVALGFAGYFSSLTGGSAVLPSAIGLLILLTGILLYGVKETAWVAIISTLIEVSGLVLIIAIGIHRLGSVNYFEMPHGITGVFAASALIFFAYQGFEAVVKFSDETMEPQITVPRALLFALVISVVLYILVAFCAVSILSWEQIAVSEAPFADIVAFSFGTEMVVIISLIALFATANTALLSMYASTRIAYGMAGSFSFPKAFGWVHPARNTPWVTIGLIGLFSVLFVFSGSIAFVANLTNFTLFITFIVINAAVLALRYHEPDIPRPFRIPGSVKNVPLVPVAGLFFSVILLTQLELPVMLLGLVLAGTGVAITFLKTRSV